MGKAALLIALLLATPAMAKDGAAATEITVQLGKTRPERPIPFPEIRDWKSLKITLVRTDCFGPCPVYKVEISGDGTIAYRGYRFVAAKGWRHAKTSAEAVRDLYARFKKADFYWLYNEYAAPVTDLPSYHTSISFDGRTKQVMDYGGSAIGMPIDVRDLENQIDSVAGTEKWVRGPAKRP